MTGPARPREERADEGAVSWRLEDVWGNAQHWDKNSNKLRPVQL